MAFRFRKSIKIAPGIRINLSKSGISTTVGIKGASVTVGHGKKRTNFGIPGTGISYNTTEKLSETPLITERNSNAPSGISLKNIVLIFIIIAIAFLLLSASK